MRDDLDTRGRAYAPHMWGLEARIEGHRAVLTHPDPAGFEAALLSLLPDIASVELS